MSREPYGECDGCGRGPRSLVAISAEEDGIAWRYLCGDCWDDWIDDRRRAWDAAVEREADRFERGGR